MATIIADDLSVCVDCALIIANDDDSGIANPESHREAMVREWQEWLDTFGSGLTMVIDSDENKCSDFSSVACAACDTRLAGYRYGACILR